MTPFGALVAGLVLLTIVILLSSCAAIPLGVGAATGFWAKTERDGTTSMICEVLKLNPSIIRPDGYAVHCLGEKRSNSEQVRHD